MEMFGRFRENVRKIDYFCENERNFVKLCQISYFREKINPIHDAYPDDVDCHKWRPAVDLCT